MLVIFSVGLNIKVFEFVRKTNNEISQIAMKQAIQVDQVFVICSSHKQVQVNKFHSTIYTLYEDKEMKKPWIYLGFWINAELWVNVKSAWYLGGKVSYAKFRNWIHLCLKIDVIKQTLSVSIDEEITLEVGNVTMLSPIERVYLG